MTNDTVINMFGFADIYFRFAYPIVLCEIILDNDSRKVGAESKQIRRIWWCGRRQTGGESDTENVIEWSQFQYCAIPSPPPLPRIATC